MKKDALNQLINKTIKKLNSYQNILTLPLHNFNGKPCVQIKRYGEYQHPRDYTLHSPLNDQITLFIYI